MKGRISRVWKIVLLAGFVSFFTVGDARAQQRLNLERVTAALAREACVTVGAGAVTLCRYDFKFEHKTVEAVVARPAKEGKYPSLMLLPGFDRTAKDLIPYGVMLAHEGFASVSVTPPGFGATEGAADFVGPRTQEVYAAAWRRFKEEKFVDAARMGVYGHSRGGMAAALMAVQLEDAKAAVAASGIYDFRRAYADIPVKGLRDKMREETGLTEAAVRDRSVVAQLDRLKIPLLVVHGEKDEKVPVGQAYLLRDRLAELKKDFELRIFPEAGHALEEREVVPLIADFFRRRMKGN